VSPPTVGGRRKGGLDCLRFRAAIAGKQGGKRGSFREGMFFPPHAEKKRVSRNSSIGTKGWPMKGNKWRSGGGPEQRKRQTRPVSLERSKWGKKKPPEVTPGSSKKGDWVHSSVTGRRPRSKWGGETVGLVTGGQIWSTGVNQKKTN